MDFRAIEIHIAAMPIQEVCIVVRGPDVLRIEDGELRGKNEDALIDPVAAFVRAITLGMMDGDIPVEQRPHAILMGVETNPAESKRVWLLNATHLMGDSIVVLRNMLASLCLESASIFTTRTTEATGTTFIGINNVGVPAMPRRLPFQVDIDRPERMSRNRYVQLIFASPLSYELAREIANAFDAWIAVLNLGGYPVPERTPADSGALPAPAFQLDELTMEQAFPDLFLCDERCFGAVLGFARRLHERGDAVDAVILG